MVLTRRDNDGEDASVTVDNSGEDVASVELQFCKCLIFGVQCLVCDVRFRCSMFGVRCAMF